MSKKKKKILTAASVKLRLWYNSTKLTHYDLRDILGVSRQSLSYYMLGVNQPEIKVKEAIAVLTNNKVSLKDWGVKVHGNNIQR